MVRSRSSSASIACSVSSLSLNPSAANSLIPLSSYGLCEAEMTAASDSPWRRTSSGAAGVGSTPPISASPPAAVTPAAIADSSISPDSRVSRMISTCGRSASIRATAVRARASARSAVRKCPARPRTPSVPNSWRAMVVLALGELRPLTGLLQPGLLALLDTRVARQEPAALELAAQVGVGHDQRARDPVPQRAGLGRHAATVHPRDHVHPRFVADGLERLAD